MIVWVGAGLAGLIALVVGAGQVIRGQVPDWLTALLLTALVLSGGALASARVKFEWAATLLERAIEDGEAGTATKTLPDQKWPGAAEAMWAGGLILIIVAALLFVSMTWYSAFNDSDHDHLNHHQTHIHHLAPPAPPPPIPKPPPHIRRTERCIERALHGKKPTAKRSIRVLLSGKCGIS